MKIKVILFLSVSLGLLSGCFSPPEFPDVPEISFENIVFIRGEEFSGDSLILSINFQDGDGDLGFTGVDTGFPYHPFDIIVDSNGDSVFFSDEPRVSDPGLVKQPVPPFFRRSPNGSMTPFSDTDNRGGIFLCPEYEEISNSQGDVIDTVYISENVNSANIYVEFLRKRNGEFQVFDFRAIASSDLCGEDFNGRFPIFDQQNFEEGKPLAGTIDYSMVSVGFELAFRMDTFRIDVSIRDRALNLSNVVSTPEFTLQGITQ